MKQIRIGWVAGIRRDRDGNTILGGAWDDDNEIARAELRRIITAANEAFGPATHWLEEREGKKLV